MNIFSNWKRLDGREPEEYRKIEIKTGIVNKAEGSALVKIGETKVLAGIKLSVSEPFPDSPDEGILVVNAEFSPIASPEFEAGPPSEDAIELARIVDRGIRESKAIELEKLKIDEKVWGVFIDIHILNDEGNLIDASALASVAALWNTKIPKLEDGEIIREKYSGSLPLKYKPVTITVCKAKNIFFLDPKLEEERSLESKLSICVRDDDIICALQKQGKAIKFEDIEKMVDIAIEKSKDLRKLL